jgi:putative transposase
MTLLAHKIELRPTPEQAEYLARACGSRRHCFNQLLAHFKQDGVKWSKKTAYELWKQLRVEFPWYAEVSARVTRNAIDDLDSAFAHFFRRVKAGQKPGFPRFKKKGLRDSFSLREQVKFDVDRHSLRIEKLKTRIAMRQAVRWEGQAKQVTISQRAGKFYASILVEATNYPVVQPQGEIVGVDFGTKNLAILSDGTKVPPNQILKANLRRLGRLQRKLSRKPKSSTSKRRARAKLRVAKLHARIHRQRQAVLHDLSHQLTSNYRTIVIEDLCVKGMVRNRNLARAVSDAGMGELRRQLEYKAALRGVQVIVADRWFPSSKTCHCCGGHNPAVVLGVGEWVCPHCGAFHDRDINAAINLENYGRHTLGGDLKRTARVAEDPAAMPGCDVDGVNVICADLVRCA